MSVDKTLMKKGYSDYDVVEIAPSIYKINEFNLTTMFVIVGTERALVVDAGTGVRDYRAVVERLTNGLPFDFVCTHAHVDHIGGRGQFDALNVSPRDIGLIKDVTTLYRKFYVVLMKILGFKVLPRKKMSIEPIKNEPRVIELHEGDVFPLGGKTVTVFETPGHTLGSLSYLCNEDRLLLTGDVINPQCLMFLKGASTIDVMRETYDKITSIDGYDTVWPSHLSEPLSAEKIEDGKKCIDKILSHRNTLLPFVWVQSYKGFVIIYRTDKRHTKR